MISIILTRIIGGRKKEEQSYPLVSPPEVDLLVPITFRWIILVKIIKVNFRIIEE